MRFGVFIAIAMLAQAQGSHAPAELRVSAKGKSLSYEVINRSPYKISKFEISTQFTSGGFEQLGCVVAAEPKVPRELLLRGACRLPADPTTGKAVASTSRLVRVVFENGLTWSPER